MKIRDVNSVIEQFDALPWEEEEMTAGIIRKAYVEAAQDALLARTKAAMRNLKAEKVRKGQLSDLRKDLGA